MNVGAILTRHRRTTVRLMVLFGLVEAALLGCFVWPSLYKTRVVDMGTLGEQTVRENRFTGTQEVYVPGRWQRIEFADGKFNLPSGSEIMIGGAKPGLGGFPLVAILLVGLGGVVSALVVLWSGFVRTAPVNQPD